MNKNSEKHKRIVRQRIISLLLTLLVLSIAGFLAGVGISALYGRIAAEKGSASAATVAAVATEPVTSTDEWYEASQEPSDEYADVPSEAVSEDSLSADEAEKDPEIESIIADMTLEQKIAQLFIITPEALTGIGTVTAAGDASRAALEEKPVGGIIYFAQNIKDPDQLKTMLGNMQSYSASINGIPLFLGVDEEGGSVTRIASNSSFDVTKFDDMGTISADDTAAAYNVGETIGKYLSEYGFNVDFAPVADVLTNPDNTVIGARSFGSDPQVVADMSWQVACGLEDSGVTACFKHFPGHGGTDGDTHTGAVSSDETLDEMKADSLVPFENAVTSGAHMIMASHVSCPAVTGDDTPACLSSVMITDVLRKDMGYSGIVITDSLSMGAVTGSYSSGEAAVMAIEAGSDILLMPEKYDEAYQALLDTVNSGTVTEERINESLRRILRVKLGKTET